MTGIEPATPQLLDLAAAVRPDWDRNWLQSAITAARLAGWPWQRILQAVVQLMCDEGADPGDLINATRDPVTRQRLHPDPRLAERSRLGAAAARELLEGRSQP